MSDLSSLVVVGNFWSHELKMKPNQSYVQEAFWERSLNKITLLFSDYGMVDHISETFNIPQ